MFNCGKRAHQPDRKFPNIFRSLSKEEQNTFGEYLNRMIKHLEEDAGAMSRESAEWYEIAGTSMYEERKRKIMEWKNRNCTENAYL